MVSFGSSKEKSKSSNKTVFPKKFFEEAFDFFGGDPGFDPKFVPFAGGEELEQKLFKFQKDRLTEAHEEALGRTDEALNQAGLLNSPVRFAKGGARDVLSKGYFDALRDAATSASLARLDTERGEAGRETEFNVDVAKSVLTAFLNKLGIAASAGREASSKSESGGIGFGITGLPKFGG